MRTIDADALMDYLQIIPIDLGYREIDDVEKYVREMPTIEAERKKGKWIPQDHNKITDMAQTLVFYYPKCSECGHSGNYDMNYCPNCGADMREDTDDKS